VIDILLNQLYMHSFKNISFSFEFRKFDIGIYVVYTSVDPLQVYYFSDEALFR